MKLVRYSDNKIPGELLGVQTEDGIIAIQKLADHLNSNVPVNMTDLLENTDKGIEQIEYVIKTAEDLRFSMDNYMLAETDFHYLPIVNHPEKIICVGMNYVDHVKSTGGEVPTNPVFFNKFSNALAAHNQTIPLPPIAQKVDYEAELVIIIGKRINSVCEKVAKEAIFGYTVGNDLSERTSQFQSSQWMIGKTFDYFAPVGPAIVTRDELKNVNHLSIQTRLNGHLVQDSSTSEMIFPVEKIVSQASQYMTLKPGDLIFTGTPSGVILEKSDPVWLKSNDHLDVTIEKIGRLSNTMA
ncbi:MAG: fumarylacetoacetate hydrolase family protein [Alkalibacterium sp.]|nr:fumarylacetoacetate hydrolase family protein [Alkalibacterium sp.]